MGQYQTCLVSLAAILKENTIGNIYYETSGEYVVLLICWFIAEKQFIYFSFTLKYVFRCISKTEIFFLSFYRFQYKLVYHTDKPDYDYDIILWVNCIFCPCYMLPYQKADLFTKKYWPNVDAITVFELELWIFFNSTGNFVR